MQSQQLQLLRQYKEGYCCRSSLPPGWAQAVRKEGEVLSRMSGMPADGRIVSVLVELYEREIHTGPEVNL